MTRSKYHSQLRYFHIIHPGKCGEASDQDGKTSDSIDKEEGKILQLNNCEVCAATILRQLNISLTYVMLPHNR